MEIPKKIPLEPARRKGWRRITEKVEFDALSVFAQRSTAPTPETTWKDDTPERVQPRPIQSTTPAWQKTYPVPTVEVLNNGVITPPADGSGFLSIPLHDQWMVFGSNPATVIEVGPCAIIQHPSVSRAHCAMIFHQGRIFVYDLGSTNRTWLIKEKNFVEAEGVCLVEDGDLIALGQVILQIVVHEKVL